MKWAANRAATFAHATTPRVGRRRSRSAAKLASFVLSCLATACLVDDDNPCGEVFVEAKDGSCMCPEGEVPSADGCTPCGAHETISAGQCVCELGYQRSAGRCVPVEEAPAPRNGADGCTSSEECPGGTLCDVHDSKECVEAPQGLGQSCTSDEDCEDTEAKFCDIFASNSCQVDGCEQDGVCPGDMACCEYAILSRSLCVTSTALVEGECPAPGVLIERDEGEQ